MINFFRKTRKKMADDNKPLKYLRYAIGEIVLVVVGILIALQINTYKNQQNDRLIEKKILTKLRVDIQKDTADLNRLSFIKQKQKNSAEYMMRYFNDQSLIMKDTTLSSSQIMAVFNFYLDNPSQTAFEMAKNSGNLFKISNDKLVDSISLYFSNSSLSDFLLTIKELTVRMNALLRSKYEVPSRLSNIYDPSVINHFYEKRFFNDLQMENYYKEIIWNEHLTSTIFIKRKINNAIKLMKMIDHQLELLPEK